MTRLSLPTRVRPTTLVVGAVAVGLLVVGAMIVFRVTADGGEDSDLRTAISRAPEEAQRFSFTDWAGVRAEMGVELDAPKAAELQDFFSAGFDADLISNTALVESAEQLQREFGFSPGSVEWELFSQDEIGSTVMVQLPDSFDFEVLGRNLDRLDYERPDSKQDDGIWSGNPDQVARIGGVTPIMTYIGVLPEQNLVVASDTPDTAARALKAARSTHDLPEPIAEVVDVAGDALSASVYSGSYACEALAMGGADPTDVSVGDELLRQAGEVNPLTAFSISAQRGMNVRVAMGFENSDQAKTNATTRAALLRGPAPGQGGDFTDRFSVDEVGADGRVVTMELTPEPNSFVLSDLSNGPVLFATC